MNKDIGLPSWSAATRRERFALVAFWTFMWGVVFPIGLVGVLAVFGTMIEGVAEYRIERSNCQKHATTPYEYHQCR